MQKATIQLDTLTCPSCGQKIESATKALSGVEKESVKVLFNSSKVKLNFDDEKIGAGQGRIALQIHDGGGIKVLWRNLKLKTL